MELKVGGTLFNSSGGGGGSFYMGRGDKDEQRKGRDEDEAVGEIEGDELAFSGRAMDRSLLPPRHRSNLSLDLPTPAIDAEAVVAELEGAIQNKMRILAVAVTRMEHDLARRLRAEIGDVVIGA